MPEYLSPGVYVEEIELGARPIEGVSTSTAGFLGVTLRGPQEPRLVTGFEEFKRLYGGYLPVDTSTLPFAVEGFFNNGGQRCFIGRVTANDALAMAADIPLGAGHQALLQAIGPGAWGNRIAGKIEAASLGGALFKLTVMYWDTAPPQAALTVTSISTAHPAVVTVAKHGLSSGDTVAIAGATHDWEALNRTWKIKVIDKDSFSIDVDTSGFAGHFDGTMKRGLVDPTDPAKIINPDRREPDLLEVYDNLSADGNSLDFYETRINSNSNLIRLDHIPVTLTVSSISKANPAVVTVHSHGLHTGDTVAISGATGDWEALNATWKITRTSADTFTIPVDTSAFTGNFDGTMALPGIPPPASAVPNLPLGMLWFLGRAGSDGMAPIAIGDYQGSTLPALPDGSVRRTGFAGFEEVDEISIVVAPDEHKVATLTTELITHCALMRYRFAVLGSNVTDTPDNIPQPPDTTYAAFYFPWIKVFNPLINQDSLMPPVGHVAGIYAATDINRGVFKSPANEVVVGADSLQFNITKREQDGLNPRGINCLRIFTSRGLRVWGARTCSTNTLWKYINVRRFFLFLGKSIDEGTQWVVFENNDERLWARVDQTITQFLITQWREGALMGTKQEEAFFVKVDRTTMTQDDIDNGRLIVIIGVAVVKPAEFVIFRLTQFPGGSSVTEG